MKTKEKDIVNQEAFNVIKRDFLASIDLDKIIMSDVLGVKDFDPEKTYDFIESIAREGKKYGLAIEKIMKKAQNINEYTHMLFLFLTLVARGGHQMPFGGIGIGLRMPKDEDISESLKRVDDFLTKLFKDMRGERED